VAEPPPHRPRGWFNHPQTDRPPLRAKIFEFYFILFFFTTMGWLSHPSYFSFSFLKVF
jgi:hypothetical protein